VEEWGTGTARGVCPEGSCALAGRRARKGRRGRKPRRSGRRSESEEEGARGERYYDHLMDRERARQHALVTRAVFHAGVSKLAALHELEQLREKRQLLVDFPPAQGEKERRERREARAFGAERTRQARLADLGLRHQGQQGAAAREELERLRSNGELLVDFLPIEEGERARAKEALASAYGSEKAGEILNKVADAGLGLRAGSDATGQ